MLAEAPLPARSRPAVPPLHRSSRAAESHLRTQCQICITSCTQNQYNASLQKRADHINISINFFRNSVQSTFSATALVMGKNQFLVFLQEAISQNMNHTACWCMILSSEINLNIFGKGEGDLGNGLTNAVCKQRQLSFQVHPHA